MPIIAPPATLAPATAAGFPAAADLILSELRGAVRVGGSGRAGDAIALLLGADRILAAGAGRSRLALAMGAIGLMHLGLASISRRRDGAPDRRGAGAFWQRRAPGRPKASCIAAEVAKRAGATVIALDGRSNRDWRSLPASSSG